MGLDPGKTQRGPAFDGFLASEVYKKGFRMFFLDCGPLKLGTLTVVVSCSLLSVGSMVFHRSIGSWSYLCLYLSLTQGG